MLHICVSGLYFQFLEAVTIICAVLTGMQWCFLVSILISVQEVILASFHVFICYLGIFCVQIFLLYTKNKTSLLSHIMYKNLLKMDHINFQLFQHHLLKNYCIFIGFSWHLC